MTKASQVKPIIPKFFLLLGALLENVAPAHGCSQIPDYMKDTSLVYINEYGGSETITSDANVLVINANTYVQQNVSITAVQQNVSINLTAGEFSAGIPANVQIESTALTLVDQGTYSFSVHKNNTANNTVHTATLSGGASASVELIDHDSQNNPLWWVSPALNRLYIIYQDVSYVFRTVVVDVSSSSSPAEPIHGTTNFAFDPYGPGGASPVSAYDDIQMAAVPVMCCVCYGRTTVSYNETSIVQHDVQDPAFHSIVSADKGKLYDVSSRQCSSLNDPACTLTVKTIDIATGATTTATVAPPPAAQPVMTTATVAPPPAAQPATTIAATTTTPAAQEAIPCEDASGNVVDTGRGQLMPCWWIASKPSTRCNLSAQENCPVACGMCG